MLLSPGDQLGPYSRLEGLKTDPRLVVLKRRIGLP
jgi:hypothetical protein